MSQFYLLYLKKENENNSKKWLYYFQIGNAPKYFSTWLEFINTYSFDMLLTVEYYIVVHFSLENHLIDFI